MPGIHTDYPFETDNRAYRHFLTLVDEHFNVVGWDDAATGRPTLITLIDIGSGDTFTLALLDSIEDRAPHVLLAFTITGELSTHGPILGATAASNHAPHLALADSTVTTARPAPLHHPDTTAIDHNTWLPVPADLAGAARPAPAHTPTIALVLLNRTPALLTVVGPFPDQHSAHAWRPTPDLDARIRPAHRGPAPVRHEHHGG
jgi:hypothetical protein